MMVLNLEQTLFDLGTPTLPLLVSLSLSLSSQDVIPQQGRECVKSGPSRGAAQKNRATYTPSDLSKQMTYIGCKQFTWEKGNLCCSLHLACILGGNPIHKVNMGEISITDIHHSKFIEDSSKIIYVHRDVHMVFLLLIPQSSSTNVLVGG